MRTPHPLTGEPLEEPDPLALRKFAVWDADQPCTKHQVAYTGTIPCTGNLRCSLCGTEWDVHGRLVAANS